jgi:hypothetical protein
MITGNFDGEFAEVADVVTDPDLDAELLECAPA